MGRFTGILGLLTMLGFAYSATASLAARSDLNTSTSLRTVRVSSLKSEDDACGTGLTAFSNAM